MRDEPSLDPGPDSPYRPAAHRPTRRSRRGAGATIAPPIVGSPPVFGAIRRLTVNFGKAFGTSRPHNPPNPSGLTGETRGPPAVVSRGPRPRTGPRRRPHPRRSLDRMAANCVSKDLPKCEPLSAGRRVLGECTSHFLPVNYIQSLLFCQGLDAGVSAIDAITYDLHWAYNKWKKSSKLAFSRLDTPENRTRPAGRPPSRLAPSAEAGCAEGEGPFDGVVGRPAPALGRDRIPPDGGRDSGMRRIGWSPAFG
jgi:hypothetical protein